MDYYILAFIVFIIMIIAVVLILVLTSKDNNRSKNKNYEVKYVNKKIYPYKRVNLLTKRELDFYQNLKPLCDRYNLHIIAKIRFADLVEVDNNMTKEYNKYFNSIKSKHIDFALTNPENMEIQYLIELDDRTHERYDRIHRDIFVNQVCDENDYKLIRTYGDIQIIEKVIQKQNNLNQSETG